MALVPHRNALRLACGWPVGARPYTLGVCPRGGQSRVVSDVAAPTRAIFGRTRVFARVGKEILLDTPTSMRNTFAKARFSFKPSLTICQSRSYRPGVPENIKRHIIAALVVNQPGCLARIANLFAARGYNIDSLVVGQTEAPELSRMTVVMHGTDDRVEQIKKQLEDVVQVAVVSILTENGVPESAYVERDLMLVKVATESPANRGEILELAKLFEAKVIDVKKDQLLVQLAGSPTHVESFADLLKPFGIIELHRSGVIAMAKGTAVGTVGLETMEGATSSIMQDTEEVDASQLPPG